MVQRSCSLRMKARSSGVRSRISEPPSFTSLSRSALRDWTSPVSERVRVSLAEASSLACACSTVLVEYILAPSKSGERAQHPVDRMRRPDEIYSVLILTAHNKRQSDIEPV